MKKKSLCLSLVTALLFVSIMTSNVKAYPQLETFFIDAPHRVDPGKKIPITVLVHNCWRPFKLQGVDVIDDGTDQDVANYVYDEDIALGELWFDVYELDRSVFSPGDTISVKARFRIEYAVPHITNPIDIRIGSDNLPKWDGWYVGDSHIHSSMTENIVEIAAPIQALASSSRAMGLDWVIVTDHSHDIDPFPGEWNTYKGYCDAETVPNEFVCMLGEEITCQDEFGIIDIFEPASHYLAYGISSPVYAPDWWGRDNNPTQQGAIDVVRSQGGIGFIAHPFVWNWDWENWAIRDYAGIEIWNGELDDSDGKAMRKWYDLLKQGRKVYAIGNSDAHNLTDIARHVRNYVYLGEGDLTESNVIEALDKGRLIITDGPLLSFAVEDHLVGDEFTTSDDTVNLTVSWKSTSEFGGVLIINVRVNGEPVENNYYVPSEAEKFEGTKSNWRFELPSSGAFSFTVYCETSEGRKAFTNPIKVNKRVLDVYMLVDLSGSFADDLPIFKVQAPNIISNLEASYPGTRFGLGKFEDYPIPPFGSASWGDKAYERVIDLTFDSDAVLSCISALFTRNGVDWPQSQLPALYQAATGAGQDLSGVGFPGASIPAGQQANFRDGATKLFILWTDATFHNPGDPGAIPYPGPSFDQTVEAIKALDPPMVIGISSGSGGVPDLKEIAVATGALAPAGGVDTDGDEIIDILEGEPLVCAISPSGVGIAEAIEALVEAAAILPIADANGPYEGEVGTAITLDGSSSFDSDGYIVLYEWDFDGDGIFDFSSTEDSTSHIYETAFAGVVVLRVTDNDGNTDTDEAAITIVQTDSTEPETWLTIGDPKCWIDETAFLTSSTSITLLADDNPGGTGVASTFYRIYNATHDSGWLVYSEPFYLTGLSDGEYWIDYYSTDNAGNTEATNTDPVVLDNTGPSITVSNPPAGWALQDGVTFMGTIVDSGSGVSSMCFSIREANGVEGTPIGFECLPVSYDPITGEWSFSFDTLLVPDGYYLLHIEAEDNLGNDETSKTVPYSIRNWAVIELLPSSEDNKAGRTMPVKFALRVAAEVDPDQPFVYNEELRIEIFATTDPDNVLQESYYGNTVKDYRISSVLYITNFKTIKRTSMEYTVAIYRDAFDVGSFTFETVK